MLLRLLVVFSLVFGSFCLGDCNRGHFGGLPCFCDSYTNGDNCTESLFTDNNCAYRMDNDTAVQLGCIYLLPYDCDDYWIVDLGVYDPEIETQVIQYPQKIMGDLTETTICFSDYKYNETCSQCFDFTSIVFTGSFVEATLDYSYSCGDNVLLNLHFDNINGTGVSCGNNGYYYPPCGFNLIPDVEKQLYSYNDYDEPIYLNLNSSSQYYGCIMAKPSLYSMDPNDSPIYCPFISMDTCNNVGRIGTYQGYEFSIDIDSKFTNQEECIVDITTSEKLCLVASDIIIGERYLEVYLELKSYMGSLLIDTLTMGYFQEYYPECGNSQSNCTIPDLNNSSNSTDIDNQYYSNSDNNNNDDDSWFGLLQIILLCILFGIIILVIIVIVFIALLIHKRRTFTPPKFQIE